MSTPTCPACGAKFSHDNATMGCKKCGLPDEIRGAGPTAIKLWQRGKLPHAARQPQIEIKEGQGARSSRRAKRHGVRKGRGSVDQATPRPRYRRKKHA